MHNLEYNEYKFLPLGESGNVQWILNVHVCSFSYSSTMRVTSRVSLYCV